MKRFILFMLFVLPVALYAQGSPQTLDNVFTPSTLSAGTSMASRTVSASLADTTQTIKVRDWEAVYLNLITLTGDSTNLLVQAAPSGDGINFGAYQTLDSLVNTTDGVKESKAILLPSKFQGLHSVRFIVKGQSHGKYSANPSGTVQVQIKRKQQ